MQFWIKVMIAVGILFGVGGVARLVFSGSQSYDPGETVGLLLVSALLISIGIYLLQFKKPAAVEEKGTPGDSTKLRSFGMPMWAVLALLVSGIGASASRQGAIGFLVAFAFFGLIFWVIESSIRAI